MTSDTRPAQPVTPVTADPSRCRTYCDGRKWAATCANASCDGCRPPPLHPSQTALVERYGTAAGGPVTPGTPSYGSLVERIASALGSGEAPAPTAGVGLPLAPFSVPLPPPSLYCTVTPIDARGRLADRSPIRTLGWRPSQPIMITATRQAIVVIPAAGGADSLSRQGHLRLPARIRHMCRLHTGGRLLVAAAPAPGRRYDHLWTRIGHQQITTRWLRHTTLTWG